MEDELVDSGRIVQQFWRHLDSVFDSDLVRAIAERLIKQDSSYSALKPLGGGKHFLAFKVRLQDLDCVLKIPRHLLDEGFPREIGTDWFECMQVLAKAAPNTVCPFKVLAFRGSYIQVMIFLPHSLIDRRKCERFAERFDSDLSALGLRNCDALQFGVYQGIALALDLSEIQRQEHDGHENIYS